MIHLVERALQSLPRVREAAGQPLRVVFRSGGGTDDAHQAIVLGADTRPVAFVKIARGPKGREVLGRERDRLARFGGALKRHRPNTLPKPLAFLEEGDRALLVQSPLPGRRLKEVEPGAVDRSQTVERVVDWLVDFTRAVGVHKVAPDSRELRRCLDEPVADYCRAFDLKPEEESLLRRLPADVRSVLGSPVPMVAAHGDFCDANILVGGAHIGVVDWAGPLDWALPAGDLLLFLLSLGATHRGLGRRGGFVRAFTEGFFSDTRVSRRNRRAWEKYRSALALPQAACLPLFLASWVGFAVEKLRYLEEQHPGSPWLGGNGSGVQQHYPLVFFDGCRCLNVSLTHEQMVSFVL